MLLHNCVTVTNEFPYTLVVRELTTNKSLYNFYTFDKLLAPKYQAPRLNM